jgi:TetR/AcrR family transcriptional regulator, repressor for neighboring sulfatase
MSLALRTRAQQRASSEAAILDAAVKLYGEAGPNGASLRDVARRAGVTHPLVSQYFGSKHGLVTAVGDRLTAHVAATIEAVRSFDAEGFSGVLRAARDDPSMTRLLIRTALGDLSPDGFPSCLGGPWTPPSASADPDADRRARICQYAASSLLLGWLAFDGFMIPAVRLGDLSERRRDQAIAAAAGHLWALAAAGEPSLGRRHVAAEPPIRDLRRPEDQRARDALLASAIELFARFGPASVSIREVARHAGLNHGLVHRHIGSKDDLITEALEVGASSLMPGALASGGFDIDQVVEVMHHDSTTARLIVRTLVDDIAIGSVRPRYPVMKGLLALARPMPAEARPPGLADPRLAAAATAALVSGSVIWGPSLRAATGFSDDVRPAMAALSHHLLGVVRP